MKIFLDHPSFRNLQDWKILKKNKSRFASVLYCVWSWHLMIVSFVAKCPQLRNFGNQGCPPIIEVSGGGGVWVLVPPSPYLLANLFTTSICLLLHIITWEENRLWPGHWTTNQNGFLKLFLCFHFTFLLFVGNKSKQQKLLCKLLHSLHSGILLG